MKKRLLALLAAAISIVCASSGAWAKTVGGFTISDTANEGTDYTYTPAGADYPAPYNWDDGKTNADGSPSDGIPHTYKRNAVLTIKSSNPITISTPAKTTDRIVVQPGITANITLAGVNIEPNMSDGYAHTRGEGRPFDMKGATVNLTVTGNNTLTAPNFSTALFCPAGSTLTINGTGTLNAQTGQDYCVAAIGGEGAMSNSRLPTHYKDPRVPDAAPGSGFVKGYDRLARLREWNDDQDGRCGTIIIDMSGSGTVNATCRTGDPDVDPWGDKKSDYVILGDAKITYWHKYLPTALNGYKETIEKIVEKLPIGEMGSNFGVAIGGAYDGSITIKGGKVNAIAWARATGIGSVTKDFGKVEISGGTVVAKSGVKTAIGEGMGGEGAASDVGTDLNYGPGIGWASYSPLGDSNMIIKITGGNVTAHGGYGGAGIGGGRNGTGGTIEITGGTIDAKGGMKAAGIGGGIGHNVNNMPSDGAVIKIGGTASVTATGGEDAAGIGGGASRNDTVIERRKGRTTSYFEGHCGIVIIEGAANVTAKGGQGCAAIGSGSYDGGNGQHMIGAGKIVGIEVTTTGDLNLTPGARNTNGGGTDSKIGVGWLGNNKSQTGSDEDRFQLFVSTVKGITTTDVKNSLTVDPGSNNLIVKGNVDLTNGTNDISVVKAIADYLNKNPDAKIVGASGSTPKLSIVSSDPAVIAAIQNKAAGIEINGQAPTTFDITVRVGASGGGSVSGNQSGAILNSVVTVTATPDSGYRFVAWTEGGSVVTNQAEYSFTVKRNHDLTAEFAPADASGGDDGGTPVLPPVDPDQEQYDPENLTPQQKLDNLQQAVGSAGSAISGALDTGTSGGSGVNIVVSGGDGTVQMVSSDKGSSGSPSFQAGQNIVQEIYLLKPGTDGKPVFDEAAPLNGSVVTVEVGYQEHVLLSFDHTITGGHMAVKIPTNDVIVKLSEHLAASGARGAANTYELWMRIRDQNDRINTTLPLSISFEMSSDGSNSSSGTSSGGGSCSAGASIFLAALALIKRRAR